MARSTAAEPVHSLGRLFGGPARLLSGACRRVSTFVLDAPHLYDRAGQPLCRRPTAPDWPDNGLRFAALARVGADIGRGLAARLRARRRACATTGRPAWRRPICTMRERPRPATVMTVHNLAFQGQFPVTLLRELGLPPAAFSLDGVEYYGRIGFLKAGLQHADRITTVSPTYAARDPDARRRHGPRRPAARSQGSDRQRHPQRHRHRSLEPRGRPDDRRPLRPGPR